MSKNKSIQSLKLVGRRTAIDCKSSKSLSDSAKSISKWLLNGCLRWRGELNKAPGREWNCSLCGHQNVIGWDRHKIAKSAILPMLTGEPINFYCTNCDTANPLTLVGHFVNLNDSSESLNGGGCPTVAAQ
jgi:hypothetical protein